MSMWHFLVVSEFPLRRPPVRLGMFIRMNNILDKRETWHTAANNTHTHDAKIKPFPLILPAAAASSSPPPPPPGASAPGNQTNWKYNLVHWILEIIIEQHYKQHAHMRTHMQT